MRTRVRRSVIRSARFSQKQNGCCADGRVGVRLVGGRPGRVSVRPGRFRERGHRGPGAHASRDGHRDGRGHGLAAGRQPVHLRGAGQGHRVEGGPGCGRPGESGQVLAVLQDVDGGGGGVKALNTARATFVFLSNRKRSVDRLRTDRRPSFSTAGRR